MATDNRPPIEPATRPAQSTRTDLATFHTAEELEHRLHWAALVEDGLIGAIPPTPPQVAAIRDANDALFRAIRQRPRDGCG